MSLKGKVALVAGATRGAGRGIAVELGAAGATVFVTGRTTRASRSEYNRAETIEETADLVTAAGGQGIAVQVDHLVPEQVAALVARLRSEAGHLDILVNDIWGGELLFEWNKPVWQHDLANGLRLLRLAIDTHLITAHYALPLLIERPGGLLVEVTDGTAEYNAEHYRLSVFYDLAKTSAIRMAWAHAKDLEPYGATSVSITPGWLRSEMMLEHFGVTEANWRDALASPAALRHLRDAALRRPGGGSPGRGRGAAALERPVPLQRPARQGLRLHRPRRLPARLLAVHQGGAGRREAGGRDRLPVRVLKPPREGRSGVPPSASRCPGTWSRAPRRTSAPAAPARPDSARPRR